MKQSNTEILMKEDIWQLICKDWMLITAGNSDGINTMTASWGGIGWLWNKPVAFVFIRPERYTHEFVEANTHLTLSFFDDSYRSALQLCGTKSGRDCDKISAAGLTIVAIETDVYGFEESRLTLQCRKLFKSQMNETSFLDKEVMTKWYNESPGGGFHDIYVVEITKVYV
jgi:flavin reductase (DIM6/NTAB) family NADH-FMN oxidoreductase RutF